VRDLYLLMRDEEELRCYSFARQDVWWQVQKVVIPVFQYSGQIYGENIGEKK
jgi:hypothetical protein